jgi:hypothetical protein
MQSIAEQILEEANAFPEGALISARLWLHLGSRAAVGQALRRLEKREELMRAARGLYVRPVHTRFGKRAPAPERVVANVAQAGAEIIVRHGAAVANALGLTTQVPTKFVAPELRRQRDAGVGRSLRPSCSPRAP